MCLLTVLPMPGLFDAKTYERLENGAEVNPHGFGWGVVSGNRVVTGKSMNAEEAIEDFYDAYTMATGPAMFHSRFATHGSKGLDNVHPFPVGKMRDTYIAHNGIMPVESHPGKDDDRSDTRVFADDILPRNYRRLDSVKVQEHLSTWLRGNKIAVLTTNRAYRRQLYVFGLKAGEWVDGVWFSNGDHEGWKNYRHFAIDEYTWTGALANKTSVSKECIFCESVDIDTMNYCKMCTTCQDCLEAETACLCMVPDGEADDSTESTSKEVELYGGPYVLG